MSDIEDKSELVVDGGYPWNVEIDVEGVTFDGPGMEDRNSALSIANLVLELDGVDRAEVVYND